MKCPKCGNLETKVVDSRIADDNTAIRRRRECDYCNMRFTTFERIEVTDLVVIKKDTSKELYDRVKLKRAIMLAFAKRDLSQEIIDELLFRLESKRSGEGKEIASAKIGEDVLMELKDVDQVAYVRFASVYREFDSIQDFQQFIGCKVE